MLTCTHRHLQGYAHTNTHAHAQAQASADLPPLVLLLLSKPPCLLLPGCQPQPNSHVCLCHFISTYMPSPQTACTDCASTNNNTHTHTHMHTQTHTNASASAHVPAHGAWLVSMRTRAQALQTADLPPNARRLPSEPPCRLLSPCGSASYSACPPCARTYACTCVHAGDNALVPCMHI
jgi:hypothetical protein